jgi:thiol-disulfide isomerase/thioredoxin
MKKLFILSAATLLVACNASKPTTTETTSTTTNTTVTEMETESEVNTGLSTGGGIYEPINQTVPYKESIILLGKVNREGFQQEPFKIWYNKNFEEYVVDDATVEMLAPLLNDVKIKAFMGTWCSDSKRETPTFYKILDAANYDINNLDMVAMSRQKDTPAQYEKDLNIFRVPTFIFYRDGQEIGRYVEFARETLEKDMYTILSGSEYQHSYEE